MDDLSSFTNADFFDYDVFARDAMVPVKPETVDNFDDFLQSIANIEPESVFNNVQQQSPQDHQLKQEFIRPSMLSTPGSQDYKSPEVKEVKKQRNTAASARFRIKKKQRQQEMELKILRLNEDISNYNNHIKKLEIENKILKNLVFEKNETVKAEGRAAQKNVSNFLQNSKLDFQYTI